MAYSSKQIRALLHSAYPIDSSFDAFCLDNFPEVYQLFTNGMNREEKTNLILALAQADLNKLASLIEDEHRFHNSRFVERKPKKHLLMMSMLPAISLALVCAFFAQPCRYAPDATPDLFAGSVYDLNGTPIEGAELILFGTECTAITDRAGYFNFNKCSPEHTAALIKPRVNIYIRGRSPIKEVVLNTRPSRTAIKVSPIERDEDEPPEVSRPAIR